jgi:predicted NBD/HSP70 family sugar kinase
MKYLPQEKPGSGHSGYQQQVKEANIKRIFDLVRSGKCKSRAEIVRHMNLSATSVSVLVEELANRKLIDETGPAQTTLPGRRPISLRLNKSAHHMAIFVVKPEGVRFALLSLECRILEERFFPLDCRTLNGDNAGEAYIQLFDDILRNRSKRFNPSRAVMIGVCFPGMYIEQDHLFHTEPALGYALTEESIRRFQQRVGLSVYLFNNTRSMAYAEKKYLDALDPDAPETRYMIFVKIQEDIRCAIISNGDVYPGPYNLSGEIGHFTIDYRGRPCYCGNTGCLERYVNLSVILEDARRDAQEAGIEPPESLEALAQRYHDEPVLMEVVRQSARLLAFGLYSIICSSGMRQIVLGGGIEILGDTFLQEVYHALFSRTSLIRNLDLSYAQAGPDAEILGVAEHYLDKVFRITM